MKCPVCGKKVKGTQGLIVTQYTLRCECGARLKIIPGFFSDKVVDWETPEEQERRKG